MTPYNKRRLCKAVNHKTGVSQRRMAARFNCDQSYVSKTLKNGLNNNPMKCRKRAKTPLYKSDEVIRVTKRKCRKLYDLSSQKTIVMDDKKYLGLTGYQMSGNTHYYTSDKDRTPHKVKNRSKSKRLVVDCNSRKVDF